MDISRLIGWRFQSDDLQEFEDNSYGVREKNLKLEDSTPARMVRQSRGFLIRHTFFLNSKQIKWLDNSADHFAGIHADWHRPPAWKKVPRHELSILHGPQINSRCGGVPNSVNAENTPMDTYM
ncbi:hypothetical protein DTO282E5_2547 [Paecilomyces variotii]|nr:hypothetical protein DTO282E5_2547 [Paecilomyces variotii]